MPVWNGLTNEFHPTQMIADMLTVREHIGGVTAKPQQPAAVLPALLIPALTAGSGRAGRNIPAKAPNINMQVRQEENHYEK